MARRRNQSEGEPAGTAGPSSADPAGSAKEGASRRKVLRMALRVISPIVWVYVDMIGTDLFPRTDYSSLLSSAALNQLLLPGILISSHPNIPLWVDCIVVVCVLALALGCLWATFSLPLAIVKSARRGTRSADGRPQGNPSTGESSKDLAGLTIVMVSVAATAIVHPRWSDNQALLHGVAGAALASIALLAVFSGAIGWLFSVTSRALGALGRFLTQVVTSLRSRTRDTPISLVDGRGFSGDAPLQPDGIGTNAHPKSAGMDSSRQVDVAESIPLAFNEYQTVLRDTSRIQDRRLQTTALYTVLHTLLTIGASLFSLEVLRGSASYVIISVFLIATFPVSFMLMSMAHVHQERHRQIVDLHIAYLQALELHMQQSQLFPTLTIRLPLALGGSSIQTRGIFALEAQALGNEFTRRRSIWQVRMPWRVNLYLTWLHALAAILVTAYTFGPFIMALLKSFSGR